MCYRSERSPNASNSPSPFPFTTFHFTGHQRHGHLTTLAPTCRMLASTNCLVIGWKRGKIRYMFARVSLRDGFPILMQDGAGKEYDTDSSEG